MILKNLKIKNKILVSFLLVSLPLILAVGTLVYFQVKQVLEKRIERELKSTTESLVTMIKTAADVSIRNRLRAIAEKNMELAQHFYSKHRSGLITRSRAMAVIRESFLCQGIGMSGYIYCIDSSGSVIVHPKEGVEGRDVSGFGFVREQMAMKDGYLEYFWKNPGEKEERAKALYMTYYKPLDWIISASSYKEEFKDLIDIDDFRASVLSYRFGKSGYAYMIDKKGNLLVHPKLPKTNVFEMADFPVDFVKDIIKEKKGKITYFWQNPGEKKAREKIVLFDYLPEYEWFVVSSGYVEEVFQPLETLRHLFVAAIISLFFFSGVASFLVSGSITRPLERFVARLRTDFPGGESLRMDYSQADELGDLARCFNTFMDSLDRYHGQIRREISDHLATRNALEKSELKFKALFHNSVQFSAILSSKGAVREINRTAVDFSGCKESDIMGRFFWEMVIWTHDAELQERIKASVRSAAGGETIRYETTNISGKNEIRAIDFSIKPVMDHQGTIRFLIAEGRDITELRQADQERNTLEKKLLHAQKMEGIGTLAAGVAHDFNNILSGIFGFSQLAKNHLGKPEKAMSDIDQVLQCAERATQLVQQILAFSRKNDQEKKPLQIGFVVKEALKLIRSSLPSTITIQHNILSEALVLANPTQIHQVIMNLCTNAYHAMMKDGGVLQVKLEDVSFLENQALPGLNLLPGNYIKLEVKDSGHGMDAATRERIFDPYFTTKEKDRGTGLGLALVFGIVNGHGGHIEVYSEQGRGTVVQIFFPTAAAGKKPVKPAEPEQAATGAGERIMLVDDDQGIRSSTRAMLEDLGFRVTTHGDGASAFDEFEKTPWDFDLILTDMTMPKMTGDELAKKILALNNDQKIILSTGYSDRIDREKALASGICAYLEKPVAPGLLAETIRMVLDGKG